jgi:hypothetical protein
MISKIFGTKSKEKEQNPLREKILNMNLSDLNLYVKEKLNSLELNEDGLLYVLERLTDDINEKRAFLSSEDDDTKLKKAFELILYISKNKYITLKAIEYIAKFYNKYENLIKDYDKKHKEIYQDRIKKSIDTAQATIDAKVSLQNKMNMLKN